MMKDENFVITREKADGVTKFAIEGRVNSKNSFTLQRKLEDSLSSGETKIILNMTQVKYLSSEGIRVIINIYKQAEKAGGKLRIEQPSDVVKNVLGLVALNDMLVQK